VASPAPYQPLIARPGGLRCLPEQWYNPTVNTVTALPRVENLLRRVSSYRPEADLELIRRAYTFASIAHQGQKRASGDIYITHPLAVAEVVAELEADEEAVAAALLHDTLEDTSTTQAELVAAFGQEIAQLVAGVTKLGQIDFRTRQERQAGNLRKMLLAMAKDLRVILIKLCDRLHNMRTLRALPEEKRRAVSQETLHIFAPIAHRLGVWRLKWELEDLSLRHLDPEAYERIGRMVARTRSEREETIREAIGQLEERLPQAGIPAEIKGRPKHFYSIYQKLQREGVDFEQIMDLEAIRVIVNTVPDCYAVLGVVHEMWLPLPDMFTDYIAKPKPNLYRALHTKVLGPHESPMEVQIRTWDMHRTAEYGVAAHWRYKEGGRDTSDQKLAWLRQLLELQTELKNPGEWLESLQIDLFKDQVFVFTPKGDVIDLPAESTPIDFAYRIHTDVGNHAVGARVNAKMVPLSYRFKNGDVVEVLTAKHSPGPSLDWLSFVVTSQAKSKIKGWYRRLRREENITRGREALEEEIRRMGLSPADLNLTERLEQIASRFNCPGPEDLLAAIGYGEVTAETVAHRLRDEEQGKRELAHPTAPAQPAPEGAVPVQISASAADKDLLFRLSRCCSPVPGDQIGGYVTRGRGVAVHREDCPNLVSSRSHEPERVMPLQWSRAAAGAFATHVRVEALDRVGLLNDILGITSTHKLNIRSANVRTTAGKMAYINLVLDIANTGQLQAVLDEVLALSDVVRVHRVRPG